MSSLRIARKVLTPTFWCLTTAICLNDKAFEIVAVNGPSMNPSLSPTYHTTGARDYLLIRKWDPTANLQRGDVVSFYTPHRPDTLGIKRVIAVEGDMVELDMRRRPENEVKGEVWDRMGEMHEGGEMEYAGRVRKRRTEQPKRLCVVPPGHVWVEGDNFRQSRDSNWYGPISKSLIDGKAVCVLLPFGRFMDKPWERFRGETKVTVPENYTPVDWDEL